MVLVLGKKSDTSIEHGSGACIRGSAMSKGRVVTPGSTLVPTAPILGKFVLSTYTSCYAFLAHLPYLFTVL